MEDFCIVLIGCYRDKDAHFKRKLVVHKQAYYACCATNITHKLHNDNNAPILFDINTNILCVLRCVMFRIIVCSLK